jgi:enoyl-CoA hydratase/carnithine racemase
VQSTVRLEIERGVAVVTLMNPPVNALSDDVLFDLDEVVGALFNSAEGLGAVVVKSGLDRYFASGADLKLLATLDRHAYESYLDLIGGLFKRITALPVPTIAAIDGYAVGGGLELALSCTLRVAGDRAHVGLPEVTLGLIPGAGGTQRLTRLIGRGRALDLLLSGRLIDAAEAERIGVVTRTVEGSAVEPANEWGRQLADAPSQAVAAIIACVTAAEAPPSDEGMALETRASLRLFETADAKEGIAAFLEKRVAEFRGELC